MMKNRPYVISYYGLNMNNMTSYIIDSCFATSDLIHGPHTLMFKVIQITTWGYYMCS